MHESEGENENESERETERESETESYSETETERVSRGEPGTPLLKSRDGHLEGGDFLQAKMASSSPRLFPAPNPKEHPKNKFGEQKSV